jgi:hypothetical protein
MLLQSSLAAAEKRDYPTDPTPPNMPRTATVLRVLIASPSDVAEHREVLMNVVQDWNAMHSSADGIVLMPVKWETHAHPASGDYPQGLINKQIVDDCDILIAAFWSRLGTPTPVAPSGTAEEIERLREKGKNVLLYFSTAPLPQSHDPEQWRMLQEYQRTLQKDILYWNFATPEELYRSASRHLASVIHTMTAEVKDDISLEKPSRNRLSESRPEIAIKRWGQIEKYADPRHAVQHGFHLHNSGRETAIDVTIQRFAIPCDVPMWVKSNSVPSIDRDGDDFAPVYMELGGTMDKWDLESYLATAYRDKNPGNKAIPVTLTYRDGADDALCYATTQDLIFSPERVQIVGFGPPKQIVAEVKKDT